MQKTEKRDSNIIVIDTCVMTKKKTLPKREYHDGDIVEFDFEPNSLDIHWHKVSIIGVVSGVLYEKDDIRYKIQLRDNERHIFGDMVVPEDKITGTMADGVMTIKCDFCDIRTHVDRNDQGDIERKTKWWERLYCIGKKHHVLNICSRCIETFGDIYDKKLICPYDQCQVVSQRKKEYLEKNGIRLMDEL